MTLIQEQATRIRETYEILDATLSAVGGDLVTASPFLSAARAFVPMLAEWAETDELRAGDPAADRPATVAEVFSCRESLASARLRFGGILLRALEGELAVGNGTPVIRARAGELAELHARWCAESETEARTIPIHDLVAIQYGAILAGAAHA